MNAAVEHSPYPPTGTLLGGRYRIAAEIGRGGYSVVYAGRDEKLASDVAIKLLVPPPASADVARERMRREARVVRELTHPNVVRLYDYLEEGPWSYLVMELVRGLDLLATVKNSGPLPADSVAELGTQLCGALEQAHARGILHRDVKPQNVLINEDGVARLADFGSARLDGQTMTRTGGIVGTLQYTAPEVLLGERPDARADVYALGLTLHLALTGKLPAGASAQSPPPPAGEGYRPSELKPDVPEWLDDVVARATVADPDDRLPTAGAFGELLTAGKDGDLRALTITRCAICDAPEPFDVGVCPACGGAQAGVADSLVFVKARGSKSDRRKLAASVEPLLEGRVHGEDRNLVVRGIRALIRVPRAAANRVVQSLSERGVPARAIRASTAWAPVPALFYLFLLSIITVGVAAGLRTSPHMLWGSPLVAALLMLAAQVKMRRPVIETSRRRGVLGDETEAAILSTFAELPKGTARSLLASLVRAGERAYRGLRYLPDPPVAPRDVETLLANSSRAALDLSALDESLKDLAEFESTELNEASMESLVAAERMRDGLVHKFLEGITLLTRLRSDTARESGSSSALAELMTSIDSQAEARREALEEVDALLG